MYIQMRKEANPTDDKQPRRDSAVSSINASLSAYLQWNAVQRDANHFSKKYLKFIMLLQRSLATRLIFLIVFMNPALGVQPWISH